jgi:hypothetical protein
VKSVASCGLSFDVGVLEWIRTPKYFQDIEQLSRPHISLMDWLFAR